LIGVDEMDVLIAICFILLTVSTFFYFYLFNKLRFFLEARYEEDYQNMGKPNLFTNSTIDNNRAFKKYLSDRQYLKHNDVKLNTLCMNVYILLNIGHILTGITMALFVINAFVVVK
jgi:hypothetical protein